MKTKIINLIVASLLIFTISCEKVVDIPLSEQEPKLVIDAILKWQKGTNGTTQTIKLSLTNNFYSNEIVPAVGATVKISNSEGLLFDFVETVANSGIYICTNFLPEIQQEYTLIVQYKNEIYTATNTLLASPVISNVTQETVPSFGGEDEIQIKYYFQDNGLESNYYLLSIKNPNLKTADFGVITDEFFQGNMMFGFYGSSETKPGITLDLNLQAISLGYYNYMNKLLSIAGSGSGSPFSTPAATVRGNITNSSNSENFPLGYFHLSEFDTKNYLVQ